MRLKSLHHSHFTHHRLADQCRESRSLRPHTRGHVEPLVVASGDFPIETLVHTVQSQLDQTLGNISNKQDRTTKRVAELEGLIETLRQWEKIDSESGNS